MLVIYKYRLKKYTEIIDAPVVNWLHVDWQEREKCYCLWALVDDEAASRKFKVTWVETGEPFPAEELDGFQYLGTVNKNIYVAHFFIAELDPETYEVLKEDDVEIPYDYSSDFSWSPDHLNWLDPDNWPGIFNDKLVNEVAADWTCRPEEVKY